MSNDQERVFAGEVYSQDQKLGIAAYANPGDQDQVSSVPMYPFGGTGGNTGNVYLVFGKYDFSNRLVRAKAYGRTDAVPVNEPASWDVVATASVGRIVWVNGIRISGGAGSGEIGDVYFDEIRVAATWPETLDLTQPYATNFSVIGQAASQVYDGRIRSGAYSLRVDMRDAAGMFTNASLPNFDIRNHAGTPILTDQRFAYTLFQDAGRTLIASTMLAGGCRQEYATVE